MIRPQCYTCRAGDRYVTAKYGGEIDVRCTLGRTVCKRKIRTYAELIAAEKEGRERTPPNK